MTTRVLIAKDFPGVGTLFLRNDRAPLQWIASPRDAGGFNDPGATIDRHRIQNAYTLEYSDGW